jgi:hypothetical protein
MQISLVRTLSVKLQNSLQGRSGSRVAHESSRMTVVSSVSALSLLNLSKNESSRTDSPLTTCSKQRYLPLTSNRRWLSTEACVA